jgi:hypothetical protein
MVLWALARRRERAETGFMELRRRSPILALAVLTASLLALAFAGSALAATQNFGPYEVTDAVTHDGSGDTATTTATYTITVPEDPNATTLTALTSTNVAPFVQAISHVDVGVCNDLADRTYTIQRDTGGGPADFGSFEDKGDPSVNNLTTPIIKWDGSQNPGTTYIYSYTVPGTWDAGPTTLYIKSGSYGNTRDPHEPFSGTVQGIACANTPPQEQPNPPGGSTTTTTSGAVAGQQVGQQQVLGARVEAGTARLAGASGCQRKAFRVKVSGKQIRKVVFTIDGKRVKKVTASASNTVYSIRVNPNSYKAGSHLVAAKVTFTAASNTRSKTMRVRFARCIRTTAPAFTG